MKIVNCRLEELGGKIGNRKIVCFGAGIFANQILGSATKELKEKIICFCDNDKKKWGGTIEVLNKPIPIICPDELKDMNMEDKIIFISSRFWDEILYQIKEWNNFSKTECFIYILSRLMDGNNGIIEDDSPGSEKKIPPILHYFWFGNKEKPAVTKKCIESWKKYCKGWEIIEWSEKNYNVRKNRFVKEVYEYGHYSALSSYARFDVVNRYGGIYVDTDVEIVKSLEPLRYHDSYMGFEVSNYINSGHGFGGCRNNDLFAENVDIYDHMSFYRGTEFVYKPAPFITSEMLANHGLRLDGTAQKIGNTFFYPSNYFDPALQIPLECTYSVHRYTSLWSFEEKVMEPVWEKQRQAYFELQKAGEINEI